MNDIQDLIKKLKDQEIGCEEKCIELKALQFDINEGEMKLFNPYQSYFFKMDPKNPRDPKVTWAATQFCKIMSVPYSFFAKNPEHMKKSLTSCWLPALKPEKSMVMAKLRKAKGDGYIIRALLPVEHTNISNVDVVESLAEALVQDSFRIDFAIGDDRDDLTLHVRFISTEEFEVCGDKCCAGFSVVASELGASPLIVETLLYRCGSKASFLATYNNESLFSFEYEKIQKIDLKNIFPSLITHIKEQLIEVKNKIQIAKEVVNKKENNYELLRALRMNKGLNEKFHTQMFQEVEKGNINTRWDFVNKMSIVAKDFPVDRRLKIERAAGTLLDLSFSKK